MAQVSFKNVRSGMSKNLVLRSPEAFEAGKHIGEEPRGLVGTFVDNIAGGLEGFASGGLNALGTAGKAFYINGEAPRAVGEMGKWLVDRSIGLDEMAAENQRRSGLLKEYEEQGLLDRVTNPKYWMDARGFAADFGNLFGSQIPFFAMSAVMPEIGVAAKVSQALNSGLGKVGLNRAAGLFAPRVKALVGGEERTLAGGAGREALGDFTSWAPTGVIDAASNTGDVAQYLREQGYSDDEIYERMKKAFGYELPYDIASQGLFGTFMGGRGVRAALSGKSKARNIGVNAGLGVVDAFNEGFQEHVQTQAVEGATDQPVGTLWNQTPGERSASTSAIIGSAVPILGGAVRNVLGSHFANSNEGGTTEVTTTEQPEEPAQPKIKTSGNADIDSIMTDAAAEYNVPVNLIHAVAQTESGYNQDARSEAGAIGVMQLMPETAEGLGVDPTDLRGNIYGGAKYLRQLMDTFGGDMQKVIAAYNAGPGAVQKHGGIPPYEETQNYVQKVMGNLEGYDLGASGDVPVQVRSLADDAAPFIGVTMSNGTEGCVEAVTKIGANSSAFLAQELKKGVVGVDRLVEDAGDNVIAFDPNQLEEGDVIVYGDESNPQRHVVLYDGKGGYIGNSSSRNQVVQGSDYNQMGDWHPTKIIKSGASFRGSSARPISAPQMDFTGLVFDEKDIAATQKALNNLVHGGQPTPEQSAAILSAAEAIRDMPLGSVDKTAEAESYNEWQKLIDTKDIAGIVDKDPEGVARMVHQLAGAQKQQQTRAAIENQQQIEATKQALEAVQKQRYEAAQARINNAVAQRNAAMQNPQMQAETPMQGAVQTPQIPMQTAPTNNIVGDTVVENAAQQTFSSPVEEAVKNLPVSREELSDILGKVQQWEQPLLSIPAYVQARDRQDWATAAQIAANAGQPGVAQFYNTLMEHGSRNAQNVTPAPQENAPTVTPYAPQENVVAAPPVQNASAPIPVVGVRPLVPERLPDSTTGRRDLAHALGRFMVANNIPISKGLRDDLSIGYRKAILYADEKIRKWENERAGNATQTAQGDAQSTETQADDRMLAQRGERAQNGSKAVRGKSAQKQGNKKAANKGELVLADGYETESGRPLTEADPKEFIIKPNGSRNFGEITKAISNAVMEQSGVSLPIGEIRLRVGDELEGLIHAKEHTAEARSAGYNSVEDLIADVAENFNQIYMREPDNANGKPTYSLVKTGDKKAGVMNGVAPIYFELQTDGNGNYYIVISAIPKGDKSLMRQTKKDHLIYSSPGLGAATVPGNSAVSHDDKAGAANRGGSPTSDKSGDLDTSTISPEEAESKENPLHEDEQTALKGLSADAKDVYRLVRDKLAGSSNKKVARAASVGAVLLARHADIIARKIRTALGKPFTAMDYYRNMFALKTEGDKTGANALHQAAMKKSDTTSLSEFSRQMRKPEAGSGSRKKMFLRITAPSGAFVDVAQDDMIHMHNHHPEMTDEDFAVIQENMENFLRVHQDKTEKGDYGGETVLCKIKTPRGIAGVSYELLPTGRIFLKTAFFDNERGIDNWITKNGTSKDIMDAGTRKRGDAASMLTGHPSRTADVADSLTPSGVQPLSLFMIQERIGVVNGEKFNQSAWHGTPHDFDAFDLGAIGTGEGAQVHGWGLYFAKVRSTSDGYREGLTEKSKVYSNEQVYTFEKNGSIKTNDGEILRPNNPLETALHSFQSHDGDIKAAIAFQQSILARERDYLEKHKDFFAFLGDNVNNEDTPAAREVRILQETIRILENEAKTWRLEKHKGATFEVEIPDNDVLLDEDKPFEYQPPFVQEKLLELFQNLLEQRTPQFLMDTHEFGDSVRDGSMAKERVSNATGKEIYDDLIDIFDKTPKEASLALNNVGIKGITYVGRQDGRCFVVFDDKAISIINKFNQQMNEVIKGTTQDIPNGQRIISLFEAADESTFLHEMGHLFLLDLEHLAPMSPTAEKDLATVKKWAEWREGQAAEYKGTPFARSFAELDKKIRAALSAGNDRRADNLKRQWEHERFARGFEMYLKTGDAPTKGLRAVFAKFRAFLQRVYQAFTGTGGKATPEVEEVMARMISIEDSSDLSAYPRGKETEVYTDSGKSIPVQYRVVSADDLIASHDASALEINPGYPSALQPRDRERVVMRQQVERMSNTLRPEELGEGRNLNQGAPLIRSDGVVLNGNGRTIAIARAQARNKERAAAYRDYLMENAETFGLSREAVERVDNPVLVREVRGDISADAMNDIIGSTTGGSRMGASENAQADADKLTHTVMDTYVPNEKGDLTTAANRDFVAGVLHKVVGQGELNAYLDKDGHVNADGIQRVKRALFAAAYGDDEIVAKMAESTDDDTRNVSNGLMAAAPMMARLSVKKDVPYMRELRDAIADAVKQLDTLRRSGDSVKDYLGAQALFSEHEDSAEMREILSFLDENKRSGKRIGNYFTHIAESLDGMENPTDSDLFETQLPSLMDVLEEAKTHAETGGQDGLFGDNAQEMTDKNTQSAPLPDVHNSTEKGGQDALFDEYIVKEANTLYDRAAKKFPEITNKEVADHVREAIQLTLDFGQGNGEIKGTAGTIFGKEKLPSERGSVGDDDYRSSRSVQQERTEKELKRGKIYGLGITRKLVNDGAISLVGQKAESAADLAEIAQVLRHPGYEKFHYIYVDDDGNVKFHETLTARLPAASPIFTQNDVSGGHGSSEYLKKAQKRIATNMSRFGATKFYFVHNHPSGDPRPSREDFNITQALIGGEDTAIANAFGGHVILDHNIYSVIDKTGTPILRELKNSYQADYSVPEKPHDVLGTVVTDEDVTQRIADLYGTESETTAFYLTTKNVVRSVQKIHDNFKDVDGATQMNYLRYCARSVGGFRVILATSDKKLYDSIKERINSGRDEGILDVVLMKNGRALYPEEKFRSNRAHAWFGQPYTSVRAEQMLENKSRYGSASTARTLEDILQLAPALEKAALEYGAKSENGKVTFTDAAQEKEFLQVAKALLSAGARKFSKAWTGSAADYDVPSLDYVGTGTGGAAYGYGLYYAEKRKTAEGYGDKLYHAEIPDADVLLDAGKSFDEQPPKVRKALEKLVRGLTLEQLENWNDVRRMGKAKVVAEIMDALSKADGTNIYGTISDLAEGQKEASELLNKYGVKGAVYNDEQNGRTFVVFDDKAIKILEKFSARRQEEIKKMLDGITLVSPNRLSPRKRALRDWGHEMGVPVVFFKGDPSLHGFHSDGVTFLNVDSEITPQWTFWHEAMHWMKANNPDLYNDIVHEISGAEGFTKEQLDAYRKEIGAEHMSDADVIEEMIADALPDVRRRVPLLRDVGKRDTGIVERLVAWVHDVMRRFHDHFFTPKGGLTNDQRRAMVRAFGNLVGSIRDADGKQIFRIANDGARITLRDGKPLLDVKYSQTDKSMKWIAEHPFTYDDAQSMDENIARAERLSKEYIDTFGTTDQINTPARQKLRREIADKLYGDGAAKKEGKVWLVLGVPASGKSTFSDPLVEREGALLIDSDEAKKMLPEFSNGLLAGAVHEESAKIAEDIFARALANHDNMVLPLVGKTMSNLQEKIGGLKEVGYEVNLIYVDLPVEKAIERTKARFRHTGRLVPPDYLRKVGLKPKENYDKLKVTEGVDSYEAWDSDVARGSTPRNIERAARPKQKASASGLGGRGLHSRQLDESSRLRNSGEESRRPSLNNENRSDNQDGFSMPKFSARTNGESRVGNFRRMMDALKSGVKPSPRVEVHDGRREVTADIGVSQVKRFMKDKRLTDDEVISRRELPNGKVRITYYARSAMDIGYADQAKSVRQVAKRNPFVKALYDLASKAMHKQEKLRNDFAKSLKEFAELVKNPADMEKVTEILWTGDATSKEYTSAELRAAGASDNVVRAYTLVRRELKKAYELLNETRMQVKTRSKVLRPEDVESYMQSHWIRPSDVLSKTQTQDGNIELTWRGGKTYETKNKLMSAEELSLMKKDENINVTRAVPANAKAYGAGMYHVGYVERIKPINNLTGYMPHFFHEWMVYEQYKDPVSKEIRYTSVGSGRTLNEAVKIGNAIAEKNKDRNYVVRPKGFDMDAENAVVVGDMEFAQMAKKLTESTQMSLADARTFLRESAGATLKSRHRFFGNMMKRKGAEGFDKNIMWVLAHYFNSSARYIAMEEFKPAAISFYERCFGAFDSEPKNMTARYCKDLINDVNGNPRGVEVWLNDLIKGTWLGKRIADSYGDRAALAVNGELSTWNAITKLGLLNFASAAVNFSQFINVGAALNDYGYAAKGLMRALHPSALDEKIIEASGLLEDINLAADNGGYSQRRGGRAGTVYQKAKQFGEWTLTPFQKADTLMRKAAVLGAYYQGVEKKGMKKAPGDELSAEAIAYAQQINDDANFDYSAANAPGMLRAGSVITQQLFQFQKYPIMQFEFMYNILKNGTRGQKVRMLVPYVLFCGIGGSIPFGELFNQLFSFLFGIATGDDEDIARDIKAEILRWAGKDPVKKSVAETALYGVLAPTFGLDISGRIGMSNAFSGEFYGQKPDSVSGVVAQQLGGPMAATAINMLHQAHEGNTIEALKAVSPALGNMFQAAVGVSRTTHHRVNTRYDSAYDKIAHALGFRSVEESTNAFVMNYDYEMRTKNKHTKQDAIQSYIDDPSDANRRTLNALGIKDRQVKEAQIQQERTAKERAKNGRPNTNGKNRSSQHKKEVKRETLLSATDDEE